MIIQSMIVSLFSNEKAADETECFDELMVENRHEVQHRRGWYDRRYQQDYCLSYEIGKNDYRYINSRKNETEVLGSFDQYHEYWGKIYWHIVKQNQPYLNELRDSLKSIQLAKSLNGVEFANAIVKMVQDIPYAYIMSDNCGPHTRDHDCLPNQKFGLTAPVEFLYSLKGDCDSRTVLLYSLLQSFGYDSLVMISKEYLHSVLAVSIPVAGEYIMHKGQKFYFWETTAKGWEVGILPPDMKNKKYWKIALDHEF